MAVLVRGATHPKHGVVDVLLEGERIAKIAPKGSLEGRGETVVEGDGYVLLPAFVDAHSHLDKNLLGMDWFENKLDYHITARIENERVMRKTAGLDTRLQAMRLLQQMAGFGVLHTRGHVDVDAVNGLAGLQGVLQAREALRPLIDVEIVAFPQSGLVSHEGAWRLMDEALAMGADVVGGLDPAAIEKDPKGAVEAIFSLAEKHKKPVDIHLHEPAALGAFSMGLIIQRTKAAGMQGMVTVSHAFCLGAGDAALVSLLVEGLAEAGITIVTAAQPSRPGVPVKQLAAAGVAVAGGNDNVQDMWNPFGNGDMLQRAGFICLKNDFRRDEDLAFALGLCTRGGANLMGLEGYGSDEGCRADLVLVKGRNLAECVAACPQDRIVIRKGQVLGKEDLAWPTA